jgi:Tfp pilus assembly protein PilN
MIQKEIKWYNLFWVRILGVLVIVFGIYMAARKTVTYYNLNEYLKTEIESLKKKNTSLDSLYKLEKEKKEKVKIIKERIQVAGDLERIKKLEKELEELRKKVPPKVEPLSPEDMTSYFKDLLKNK